jgi:hypothetical protein
MNQAPQFSPLGPPHHYRYLSSGTPPTSTGGRRWSCGDTWRPWSCPAPGGGCRSHGDTWRPWSCPAPGSGRRSRGDTWWPRSCLQPGGGARATTTRGGLGAALSWEGGTTPPPPLPRPSARGQGVVVPVTPPDNPHRMITRGKTGVKVVPDHLVLTTVTSSPTPSPIPSSTRVVLNDSHWRAAMEDEFGALISNGT